MADKTDPKEGSFASLGESLPASLKAGLSSLSHLDDLIESAGDLAPALKSLQKVTEANIKITRGDLDKKRISSKQATAALDSQVKMLLRLEKVIGETSDSMMLGAEEIAQFGVEVSHAKGFVQEHNKALYKGSSALEERIKIDEQQIVVEKKQQEAVERRTEAEKDATERYNDTREALGNLGETLGQTTVDAKAMGHSLAAQFKGTMGRASQRLGFRDREGNLSRRGKAGLLAGGVIAAVVGTVMKIAEKQRKALVLVAAREFQYGSVATIDAGRKKAEVALERVRKTARSFGQDMEEAEATLGKVAAQTGASYDDAGDAIERISGLALAGFGSVAELGERVITIANDMGVSTDEASRIMEDVAITAKSMNLALGGEGAVTQMDDFFAATMRVAESVDGLTVSHRGLAKSMAVSLKAGKNLDLSYNRRIKAAEGLTRALASNYDQGFATLNINEDLDAAMKSTEEGSFFAKEAADIKDLLDRGVIHQGQAAQMLKESGAGSTAEVSSARMERSALALVNGNASLATAMLGELSKDQIMLLEEIGNQLKSGKTLDTMELSDVARSDFQAMKNEVARQTSSTASNLMGESMDSLMTSLSGTFATTLNLIVDALTSIRDAVEWWKGVFKNSRWFKGDDKSVNEKIAAEKRARDVLIGGQQLNHRVAGLAGKGTTLDSLNNSPGKAIDMLASDKTLQDKFRANGRGLDPKMITAINDRFGKDKKAEAAALISSLQPSGVGTLGRMKPDGSQDLNVKMKNSADRTQEANSILNEQSAATATK